MSYLLKGGRPPRAAPTNLSFAESSAPTPEFRQHHDVAEPEITPARRSTAWTINRRFMSLHPDAAMLDAADRFQEAWALGMENVRAKRAPIRVDGGARPDGYSDARLEALRELREISATLGAFRMRLLFWCLISDLAWTAVGSEVGCQWETAKRHTRKALLALVGHYTTTNQTRRPRTRSPGAAVVRTLLVLVSSVGLADWLAPAIAMMS